MAQQARVDTNGHYVTEALGQRTRPGWCLPQREDVTLHGLFDAIWDLCGVKEMSVIRSVAGIQALVVSVAIVVSRRFLCVAGACRGEFDSSPNLSAPSGSDSLFGAVCRSGEFFFH